MAYCIYLRKSRADAEAEAMGEGESLARHEAALKQTAARLGLEVSAIYREIVSGETISSRPVMQRLLSELERGVWDGVLVMEVERLARGDTIDQGVVAQAFRLSGARIVTPSKTYDPNNEFDEEYFEFGLFMSRREYKAINRRLQRGRMASAAEGKWVGNRAPYGYRRYKLQGQKGWSLEPDPETAHIVRQIFEWYVNAEGFTGASIGISEICGRLGLLGARSASGGDWTNAAVRGILKNPAYAGWIRWGARATVKKIKDGAVVISRPRAAPGSIRLERGLHAPLVSQEVYDAAQSKLQSAPSRPGPRELETKNPLCGLVLCADCGHRMVRRPYRNRQAALICAYPNCKNVSSDLAVVEAALVGALRRWFSDFKLGPPDRGAARGDGALRGMEAALTAAGLELYRLERQKRRARELVEQDIYTEAVYLERRGEIELAADECRKRQAELTSQIEAAKRLPQPGGRSFPADTPVMDAYALAKNAGEKNALLKSVVFKAVYQKRNSARWGDGGMELTVYPKFPGSPDADNPDVPKNWDTWKW